MDLDTESKDAFIEYLDDPSKEVGCSLFRYKLQSLKASFEVQVSQNMLLTSLKLIVLSTSQSNVDTDSLMLSEKLC